mmetsp:Transcript_77384/g.170969  ORF Transcript_77384/g.170969 Transcript_77384/m.170969 type:complete len:246 (-) Transcript_77384:75-812(-)
MQHPKGLEGMHLTIWAHVARQGQGDTTNVRARIYRHAAHRKEGLQQVQLRLHPATLTDQLMPNRHIESRRQQRELTTLRPRPQERGIVSSAHNGNGPTTICCSVSSRASRATGAGGRPGLFQSDALDVLRKVHGESSALRTASGGGVHRVAPMSFQIHGPRTAFPNLAGIGRTDGPHHAKAEVCHEGAAIRGLVRFTTTAFEGEVSTIPTMRVSTWTKNGIAALAPGDAIGPAIECHGPQPGQRQ